MTVKSFFKSNVFKCLVTLLCVLLVSGIFLTIMNGLLAVSDEERFQRDIQKIYGKSVSLRKESVADYNDNAKILEAYYVLDDGNYLVKSKGLGGFDNGTITCWVVVGVNKSTNTISGIEKVVKSEHDSNQTYISNITDNFYQGFYGEYKGDFNANEGFIKTGATRSATAICNAVNGAVDYVNGKFLGNVANDVYAGLKYTEYVDTKATKHEPTKDGFVLFHVVTKGYGMATPFSIDITVDREGVIKAYTITKNGTDNYDPNKMHPGILDGSLFVGKTVADVIALAKEGMEYGDVGSDLKTNATNSNYLCLYAAAFAAENYQKFLPEEVEQPEESEEAPKDNEEGGQE